MVRAIVALQAQEAATAGNAANAVDQLSPSGVGMLHLFAALGWEWGLTALLLANADVDLRDARGRTALHWAAARGHEVLIVPAEQLCIAGWQSTKHLVACVRHG